MNRFNTCASAQERAGQAVSRPELERLEAQRRTPAPVRILTPYGAQHVNATLDHQQEKRIEEITARLDAAAGRASDAFARGKLRGTAKKEFERDR